MQFTQSGEVNGIFNTSPYNQTGIAEKALIDYIFEMRQMIDAVDMELAGYAYDSSKNGWILLPEADRPYKITEKVRHQLIGYLYSHLNQIISLGDIDQYNTGIITRDANHYLREFIYVNFEEGGFEEGNYKMIYLKVARPIEYMLSRARNGAEKFKFLRPTHSSNETTVKNLEVPQQQSTVGKLLQSGRNILSKN